MDLQILRFFVVSAEKGSFSAAAESLQYAQSNLSGRMKQLEAELGEKLFYRDRRGVALTSKGSAFYEYARKIIDLSDEAVVAMKNMEHACGKLMIGTIEATAFTELPSLLLGYRRENPDVQLSLKVDLNDVFLKPLMERSLDGAFIAGPVVHPELTSIRLKQERLVLVGSRNEAILSADQILTEAPLVTFPEGSVFRRRLELLLASEKLSFQDRMTYVNSLGAMIATISAGVGYGYLPLSIVEPYVREGLVSIYPFEDPYSEYDVVFAYRRDHIMDAAFRNFIACVQRKEEELSGRDLDG